MVVENRNILGVFFKIPERVFACHFDVSAVFPPDITPE